MQVLLALVVAACTTANGPNASSMRRVQFDCEGTGLTVQFQADRAELTWKDGKDTLDQKPAASGIWYESPRNALRGKGQDATWTREGLGSLACKELH
jgi:membrane-bound inhibitor of C-type lysozyme